MGSAARAGSGRTAGFVSVAAEATRGARMAVESGRAAARVSLATNAARSARLARVWPSTRAVAGRTGAACSSGATAAVCSTSGGAITRDWLVGRFSSGPSSSVTAESEVQLPFARSRVRKVLPYKRSANALATTMKRLMISVDVTLKKLRNRPAFFVQRLTAAAVPGNNGFASCRRDQSDSSQW